MIVIVRATINDELYDYLIQLLNERFYSSTDINELCKINKIFKALNYETESWLSAIQIQPKDSKQKN